MARWRGIFGRKGKRDSESEATPTDSRDAGDPATDLYPSPAGSTDAPAAERPEGKRPTWVEPDTGTAEWAPPSPVSGRRRRPEPEPDSTEAEAVDGESGELEAVAEEPVSDEQPASGEEVSETAEPEPAEPEPEPDSMPAAGSDTGDRIRVAADEAAQAAEMRSHDEILALERNLEQANASARAEVDELTSRLREAEARATQAEERAAELATEKEQVETRAREQATQWLRRQVAKLKAEAQQRVREEVERIRAEAAAADKPEAASGAEAEGLRSELQLAREEAEARVAEARDSGRREALEGPGGEELERRIEATRLEARTEVEAEMEREAEPRRKELERRALVGIGLDPRDPLRSLLLGGRERVRAEVAIARKAAEERFAALLGERERELQTERETRAKAIADSHERLGQIERQAIEAAERVSAAEQNLEDEKVRLREESAAQLEVAAEQARAVADAASAERMRDREEELSDAIAAAAKAEHDVESKVAEAEAKAREAEERSRELEAEAAAAISEVRQAAADWLRDQTKAVRAEAERAARSGDGG